MYVNDFEFDGKRLSDFGLTCVVWDGDPNASSVVANIDFTTHRQPNGDTWHHYDSQFAEPLTTTIEVGYYDCTKGSLQVLTPYELSPVMRWLTRRDGFKAFRLPDQEGYEDLYFYAQMDVTPILYQGKVYGLSITVNTNRPYPVRLKSADFTISAANGTYTIVDESDDVGYTPILMRVTTARAGTLTITNDRLSDSSAIEVKNCSSGEVFTFDGENLVTTEAVQRTDILLAKRYNFRFPKLLNTYDLRNNVWTFSLPCTVHAEWKSPVKVGF